MWSEAARLKLRAERKAGEPLAQMAKAKTGRPPENRSHNDTDFRGAPTLATLGISTSQSSRFTRSSHMAISFMRGKRPLGKGCKKSLESEKSLPSRMSVSW